MRHFFLIAHPFEKMMYKQMTHLNIQEQRQRPRGEHGEVGGVLGGAGAGAHARLGRTRARGLMFRVM